MQLLEYNVVGGKIASVKIKIKGVTQIKENKDIEYLPEENPLFKELKDKLTKCKTREELDIIRSNIKDCRDAGQISPSEREELLLLDSDTQKRITEIDKKQ